MIPLVKARRAFAFILAACGVVVLVTAAVAGMNKRNYAADPVSAVIFPAQQIPLRFSHVKHLKRKKMGCDFCHEDAEDSESSLDNLIPTEEACDSCHDIDRNQPLKKVETGEAPARCDACHPGFDPKNKAIARVKVPTPNIKFNHSAHIDQKIACTTCHGDLAREGIGLANRDQLPKMLLCLQCHDDKKAPGACNTCHLTRVGGYLKTDYPQGKLKPSGVLRGADHDMNFRTSHKFVAQNDERYCATCHRKEFCVGCHNGVTKPMDFHNGDYITLHPIEARRNSPDCSSCHRTQTFCVGCHSRSGVSADGRGSEFLGPSSGDLTRRFHPDGWVVFDGGLRSGANSRGAMHHSFQAQRNIRQCASCHREEFCTTCHSAQVGSFRINPHPNNWVNSRRCKALAKRSGRMCLRCHTDVSQARCDFMAP